MRQLLIFGDSILKGVTFNGKQYHLCKDRLPDSVQDMDVISYAKMGATVETGLNLIQAHLSPCIDDTTVLISFGGNDCSYDWSKISSDPSGHHLPKTPEQEFVSSFRAMIRSAQNCGAHVAVTSLLPIEPERYFEHICIGNDRQAILSWLGDKNRLYRWQEYYNSLVCTLARAFGCRLIDLRTAFLQNQNFPLLLGPDGIHPTEDGYRLLHHTILTALCY